MMCIYSLYYSCHFYKYNFLSVDSLRVMGCYLGLCIWVVYIFIESVDLGGNNLGIRSGLKPILLDDGDGDVWMVYIVELGLENVMPYYLYSTVVHHYFPYASKLVLNNEVDLDHLICGQWVYGLLSYDVSYW